jgi:hypothetical protein
MLARRHFSDGAHDNAQLCVWKGASLALESVQTWRWGSWTVIYSVLVGNVDDDGQSEIVTGGYYDAGVLIDTAQLCVWSIY